MPSPSASHSLSPISFALLALALGCSQTPAATADSGTPGTDGGAPTSDTGTPTTDGGGSDVGSVDDDGGATDDDGGTAACAPFRGRYVATDIRCNGEPFTQMAALTPPAGGWYLEDDGTTATFTTTIGTCSLIATGHIDCDAPVAGELTHTPDAPLECDPPACVPFATRCSGSTTGTEAVWTYTVETDGTVHTETIGDDTPIATCTAAGQENPVQVTWELVP